MYILLASRAAGWQHTGILRLHYMLYSSTFRAAGWQPTGF